jgi:transcriptional regulator with XRE-family HTH domain
MSGTLAEELRQLRSVKQASLRDVEHAIGISNAYLSQLERGAASKPSPHWLYKLSQYYKVPYELLMALAGYLKESKVTAETQRIPKSLEMLLMSANLSDEEQKQVTDYIQFLASRRSQQK